MLRYAGLLLACVVAGAVRAHPHENIDQQVLLSVGAGEVIVQIRIAPSYIDGAAIFAHIDADGDGVVSVSEAEEFGSDVMARATLSVDGRRFDFNAPKVSIPAREWVSAGVGLIEVDATAAINIASLSRHRIDFRIGYDEFAHDWFIQPFYYPELMHALPEQSIGRSSSGDRVEIALAP